MSVWTGSAGGVSGAGACATGGGGGGRARTGSCRAAPPQPVATTAKLATASVGSQENFSIGRSARGVRKNQARAGRRSPHRVQRRAELHRPRSVQPEVLSALRVLKTLWADSARRRRHLS